MSCRSSRPLSPAVREHRIRDRLAPAEPPPADQWRALASRVVDRLVGEHVRIAVIDDNGRPLLVDMSERLYEVLQRDHPIIGVYKFGTRSRDVIDDLEAYWS